jgi:uncharacterized protein
MTAVKKWLLVAAGFLFLGLAAAGVLLPILPTTPFLLLAAACFCRSSERLYSWLINHRWFGPYIFFYRQYKAVSLRAKLWALFLLWGTIGYSVLAVVEAWWLRGLLLFIAVSVSVHVLSIKTLTREMMKQFEKEKDSHPSCLEDNGGYI